MNVALFSNVIAFSGCAGVFRLRWLPYNTPSVAVWLRGPQENTLIRTADNAGLASAAAAALILLQAVVVRLQLLVFLVLLWAGVCVCAYWPGPETRLLRGRLACEDVPGWSVGRTQMALGLFLLRQHRET